MIKNFEKMNSFSKICFSILIGFAVVAFWRGIWGILDIYLFPNNLTLSFVISIVAGLVVLIATHYTSKELM